MMTITAHVNGQAVGQIHIQNTGQHKRNVYTYDVALISETDEMLGIQVEHDRSQPWYVLVAKVAERVWGR